MIGVRTTGPFTVRSVAVRSAAALLATVALATGCSATGGQDAPGEDSGTPRMTIGMVSHSGDGDTFWDIVQNGAQQAAAKGKVKFLYAHDKEGGQQAALIQSYIDQKVDGLIVTLAKPQAVKAVVRKAVARGIPVITINSGGEFSAAYGALTHIGQDESVAGRAVGDELNARRAKKVLCVIHEQGNVSLEDRCAGVRKAFRGTVENIDVDGTNAPNSQSSIEAKLQSDTSLDAIVALGAPMAAISLKAKEEAGSRARIATFDLNSAVVKLLKAKDLSFAVDQQPFLQGYEAVDLLWLHKTNADVLGGGKPVLTGPALVTEKDVPKLTEYTGRGTR
ncbi:substrate-binding domain-containing protein [Streptomyces sp. Je 1-4]|uniref:substrate-binding domain-containing protein n=1 Tax=Streptomyces TaxID=1883 RepID=UPI0021D818F4|nr:MULTISPECIES: substrate-binding domain-containing protein [unclassified Streptomyces]UYB39154.1 substrate-binding domain-containing protein [Streptomyces sp. Je 1-4]UZQ35164.1 substrate-binding domain-containing protein [Streptomyces sp. Je 1-4] [Streptomyces sp. Je 1-4 4N24]UZQ42582.1 substrate-binding domain-containing protein [Streptomyces sp. Je 1-4] [Streptomyces sp. Je 1-4 4N24_ara]